MKIVSLAVAVVLATGALSAAFAQDESGGRGANPLSSPACDEFAKKNCPGMQGNERRACLETNISKLNPDCRAMVAQKPPSFPKVGQ
jgi:hypothetical protein